MVLNRALSVATWSLSETKLGLGRLALQTLTSWHLSSKSNKGILESDPGTMWKVSLSSRSLYIMRLLLTHSLCLHSPRVRDQNDAAIPLYVLNAAV